MNSDAPVEQTTKSEKVWSQLQADVGEGKEVSVGRIGEVFKVLVADYLKGRLGLEELALACNDLYYQVVDPVMIDKNDPDLGRMIDEVYELWIKLSIEEKKLQEKLGEYVRE